MSARTAAGVWVTLCLLGSPFIPLRADPLVIKPATEDPVDLLRGEDKAPRRDANAPPRRADHRWGLGVNYLGAQLRYYFSSRWALEGRYQQGKASSDAGDVKAQVYGLRLYRYFHPERRFVLYWAGEGDRAAAKSETGGYKVEGFTIGAVGGFEFKVASRVGLAIDLGPYVISLKERQTQLSETNLDFVLNTALVVHLF